MSYVKVYDQQMKLQAVLENAAQVQYQQKKYLTICLDLNISKMKTSSLRARFVCR